MEKAMVIHSSTLAWKIPWTEDPGRLQSTAKSRAWLRDFTFTFHFHALEKEMATHSSVLARRIPAMGAWWAAVYGVAQSRTWLKWLSSSSSSWPIGLLAHGPYHPGWEQRPRPSKGGPICLAAQALWPPDPETLPCALVLRQRHQSYALHHFLPAQPRRGEDRAIVCTSSSLQCLQSIWTKGKDDQLGTCCASD